MAPRRGGGSSTWGGSASGSCEACNEPLYLEGFDWKVGFRPKRSVFLCINRM